MKLFADTNECEDKNKCPSFDFKIKFFADIYEFEDTAFNTSISKLIFLPILTNAQIRTKCPSFDFKIEFFADIYEFEDTTFNTLISKLIFLQILTNARIRTNDFKIKFFADICEFEDTSFNTSISKLIFFADTNECADKNKCPPGFTCQNTNGSFVCNGM
jgi:hypothetical protein